MRTYIDLDDCLYNWRAMIEFVVEDLANQGFEKEFVWSQISALSKQGFSFEKLLGALAIESTLHAALLDRYVAHIRNGESFLYPDVIPWLQSLTSVTDLRLVTFGYPPYQRLKWEGLASLHPYFSQTFFVFEDMTKGEAIARDMVGYEGPARFIDDKVKELRSVAEHAPQVALFQMLRYGVSEEDGPWQVVNSFPEIP